MCSSQDPSVTDERTTTERYKSNYKANLPWELTAFCSVTIGDTMVWFIQGHMDFSSELYNAHKHSSMQQQTHYVRADINIFDNY
jgi:hypothetical protein